MSAVGLGVEETKIIVTIVNTVLPLASLLIKSVVKEITAHLGDFARCLAQVDQLTYGGRSDPLLDLEIDVQLIIDVSLPVLRFFGLHVAEHGFDRIHHVVIVVIPIIQFIVHLGRLSSYLARLLLLPADQLAFITISHYLSVSTVESLQLHLKFGFSTMIIMIIDTIVY